MAVISLPTGIRLPAECTIGQARYDVVEVSDATGSEAARLLGPPRWRASIRSATMTLADAGLWESVLLQLRGRVNHLALWDPVRQRPSGTLRGSGITLNATASAGATSLVLLGARAVNNLLTQTRAFDGSAWTAVNGGTATADTTVAPDGTTTADTITDANAVSSAGRRQTISIAADATTYITSLFLLKTSGGTSPTVQLQTQFVGGSGSGGRTLRIDTDSGTALSGSGTIIDYDATWWRVVQDAIVNDGTNTSLQLTLFPAVDAHGGSSAVGSTTGSAVAWGAQVQAASAVTEYEVATVAAGDWLQLGAGVGTSQLVKVVAAATAAADGLLTVTIEPPLRIQYASGTAVTVERPVAYYRLQGEPSWSYQPGAMQSGFAADLLEAFG